MYKFHDLSPNSETINFQLSSEALRLGDPPEFIGGWGLPSGIDTHYIENLIPGYRTLSVSGRGSLGIVLIQGEETNVDGANYIDSHLPERSITINYLLNSSTPQDLITMQHHLSYLLNQRQFKFSFDDDPDSFYLGTVTEFNELPEGVLNGTGSFTITCSDPYMYSATKTATIPVDSNATQLMSTDPILPIVPDEIRYTPKNTTTEFTITSGDKKMTFKNATIQSGETIIIRPHEPSVTLNDIDHMDWFLWTSEMEYFYIGHDFIYCNPGGTLYFEWREKKL